MSFNVNNPKKKKDWRCSLPCLRLLNHRISLVQRSPAQALIPASESPPWSLLEENDSRDGYRSMRKRLVKKPKRVDSFHVEAMEIAGAHGHHSKVLPLFIYLFLVLATNQVIIFSSFQFFLLNLYGKLSMCRTPIPWICEIYIIQMFEI